jgi:hypothetical protein
MPSAAIVADIGAGDDRGDAVAPARDDVFLHGTKALGKWGSWETAPYVRIKRA